MTLSEVMRVLEAAGNESARKTYARHGAKGPMFGVRFGDLFTLMKKIRVDHALARQLWATGNVDARNLAMKIADPAAMSAEEIDRWAIENEMGICDLYIASIAVESPHGRTLLDRWLKSPDERRRAIGWTLLGRISDRDEAFPEDELLRYLERFEKTLHAAPNAERAEMNKTLIALGGRSPALRKAATAVAKRLGKVEVDHGDTACATPDAVPYIDKMWERSGKKFPSPAAAERSRESMRLRC
jgi:3-methyladenine DNA glycosylase AlkD